VLNTYRVWLVYELFRGSITAEQLAWCEKQMRDFVASRSSNNPHLRATVGIENMDANDLNSDHCLRFTSTTLADFFGMTGVDRIPKSDFL
jgi:hypothetical protein